MTDKGKGTQVASDSLVIRSSRVDINASRLTSQPGAAYASEEQPLWVGIKVVTKYVGAGGGNVRFVCGFCQDAFVGSYTRVRAHLLKLPHFGIRACSKISTEKVREFKKLHEHADSIQKKKSSAIATDVSMPLKGVDKKRKTCQSTIETYFNSCGRAELDRMIGKFFFSSGIPFSVAENPYWKKFVTALANSKLSGYVPPSPERLRTSLLKDEKDAIEQNLARKKFKWNTTGVSIVSDGWINIQRHPSINFIAIASDEPIFLRTFDTSERFKDVEYLKSLFVKVIKEVGPDKVVQIITDNVAVCKSVESGLKSDFPHVFWTPCVAHTLNLALEDICYSPSEEEDARGHELFSWIQDLGRDAKNIKNFIVNHQHAFSLFDTYSDLKLLKVAETRFASIIAMMKRIQCVKNTLVDMVLSKDWDFYRAEDKGKAQAIKFIIMEDTFWDKLAYFLTFTNPIWCMLREVYKDEPMLHKVYEMWDNMIKQIQFIVFEHEKKNIGLDNSEFFDRIHSILVEKWDKSNTPLHCMAYSLNPKYYTKKWLEGTVGRVCPNQDHEISKNRISCMERLYTDPYVRKQVTSEYARFCIGNFDSLDAVVAREDEDLSPFDWWSVYGSEMPALQKLALRLVSQPVTLSCCKRNLSTYFHIQNIKRNELTNKHVEDLVFVHSNLHLLSRKPKKYSCGSSKFWDVDPEEFDFEGNHMCAASMSLIDPIIHSSDDFGDDIESMDDNY
ncbi:uncharacterized protein LOC116258805 isoform X2 [Nymphaea colorata]|nr:uncharacterized protein LOC116258805 isoform X2 [Nymphaea colorata]